MFEGKNVFPDIYVKDIFEKVSEYDIFSRYCQNFKELDKSFSSEFYTDKNPSCYITDNNGKLMYKDFGSTDILNCFEYVMKKYNCNFNEAKLIISNDFNLASLKTVINPSFLIGNEKNKVVLNKKSKTIITIKVRNWDIFDYNYWSRYSISFSLLDKYNVFPCSHVYLNKNGKTSIIYASKDDPIYAYRFIHEGVTSYKIYRPLTKNKKYKFIFNGSKHNIEGEDQLPWVGDLLVITKSLKDVICLRMMGYNSISLQGEANTLEEDTVVKLKKRFDNIIIFYDPDNQGIESSAKICSKYGFKSIIVPPEYNSKDTSDLIENKGFIEAKEIINKLIDGK